MAAGLYYICPDFSKLILTSIDISYNFNNLLRLCFFFCWTVLWADLAFRVNQFLTMTLTSPTSADTSDLNSETRE